ncbi:hypothetical protein [Pseudoalteromonas luteoviolacea]|uniref:hypothetical protein n=1 Tax=Pseudoalteromonas luteoviolacea TaxID=43657 RepID=UPI0007B165A1|nr:hypothetical protein [Pseudoalteromonas luteoviolacea]KZN54509.1 hypothetical protein N474_01960 [Pseudoalteromonas luteoviolacea CPMOR-2]TQF70347.1 hypothetical protein FLM44_04425 [Pseudoalteromonas luteoviolacea]
MKSIIFILSFFISFSSASSVEITTANQTVKEQKIKSDLLSLHKQYDLTSWLYTKEVLIDENAKVPFSHPVITMSTQKKYLEDRVKLLSTYLHEQFHWHVIVNGKPNIEEFQARIKQDFPTVKVGFPHGSRDEGSTLSHIIVCYLEYIALAELVGEEKARQNLSSNGYYKWVYATVLDPANKEKLDKLLSEFGLEFRETKRK